MHKNYIRRVRFVWLGTVQSVFFCPEERKWLWIHARRRWMIFVCCCSFDLRFFFFVLSICVLWPAFGWMCFIYLFFIFGIWIWGLVLFLLCISIWNAKINLHFDGRNGSVTCLSVLFLLYLFVTVKICFL